MSSEHDLWLCFFRGLNVFGHGKISMVELKRRCTDRFRASGLGIRFIDYHGATGNIAILATDIPAQSIRRVVAEAIPIAHALVTPSLVDEVAQVFHRWSAPADAPGFRWTPGVSLLCDGEPGTTPLHEEPDLGRFLRVGHSVVAVYRKERETARGTLDSADRAGGWAAVSQHTEDVLGGLWTARSFATPRGLRINALWKLRTAQR
jgi:hypothetical protein